MGCSLNVQWLSPFAVRCTVPEIPAGFPAGASEALVVVEGQRSQSGSLDAITEVISNPTIRTISPNAASEGQTILILGSGFGSQPSDVMGASIAGQECLDRQWQGPTAVVCTVPPIAASLAEQATTDVSVLTELDVAVTTRGGLRNE